MPKTIPVINLDRPTLETSDWSTHWLLTEYPIWLDTQTCPSAAAPHPASSFSMFIYHTLQLYWRVMQSQALAKPPQNICAESSSLVDSLRYCVLTFTSI